MPHRILVPLLLLLSTALAGCTTDGNTGNGDTGPSGTYEDPRSLLIEDSGEALPNGPPVHEVWEFEVPDTEFTRIFFELRYYPREGESEWRFKGPYDLQPIQPSGEPNGAHTTAQDRFDSEEYPAWTRVCSGTGTCRPDMDGTWRVELSAGAGSNARWTFHASVTYPPLESDPATP